MSITLNICLYLSFTFVSATFISDSCQIQGHFKLNGMYQGGDFIIGGLFEVQHLKIFPELSFRMEPEQPKCEEWVWKVEDGKLCWLKIMDDWIKEIKKTESNNWQMTITGKGKLFSILFIWLHAKGFI